MIGPAAIGWYGRRARRRGTFGVVSLLAALALSGALAAPADAQRATASAHASPAPPVAALAAVPELSAAGAVLWDPADGKVLYGKAETVGRPMASTTKIMTALLALEAGAVDEQLIVSATAAALGAIGGAANLELRAGQTIPVRSLLAGLIIRSGNDAAVAVAEHVAGSEAAFVEKMNARAVELGLSGTRFVNASGLTDDLGHHASPVDLARLAQVAMQHAEFAQWAGARSLDVPGLAAAHSRNELLASYPGATGVKTGYTDLAGLCLVASATRDGRTLYAVVLGSEDSFAEAAALLDHGFEDFRRPQPVPARGAGATYRWADAEVALLAAETLTATVPVDAPVTWRAVLEPSTHRPVEAGAPLGTAELMLDGQVVHSTSLLAAESVADSHPVGAAAAGAAINEAVRAFARLRPIDQAA